VSIIDQTKIANRACQRVGAELIAAGALLTEDSKPANEIRNCYDILRRAELRRNVWRFGIRTQALRPLDVDSKLVTFGAYNAATTYALNDIIVGDDTQVYISVTSANVGNTPSTSPTKWTLYFGLDVCMEFITTWGSGFTYMKGDHAVGSDGSVYISLQDTNTNHNPVGDGNVHWSVTTDGKLATNLTFYVGELVHIGNTVYLSLQNNNGDGNTVSGDGLPPPSSSWQTMTTAPTIALFNFMYPIGAGPSSNFKTKNTYRLPVGWLREAPQDPKAGGALYLGAPDGSNFNDWNYEGNYFTSNDNGVIPYRFMADIQDPMQFDALFVEGFGCRIALEVCEILTQSDSKKAGIERAYMKFMTEARTVNGIEDGPIYPPEDSYITTRF
jgi:hypothetical protein